MNLKLILTKFKNWLNPLKEFKSEEVFKKVDVSTNNIQPEKKLPFVTNDIPNDNLLHWIHFVINNKHFWTVGTWIDNELYVIENIPEIRNVKIDIINHALFAYYKIRNCTLYNANTEKSIEYYISDEQYVPCNTNSLIMLKNKISAEPQEEKNEVYIGGYNYFNLNSKLHSASHACNIPKPEKNHTRNNYSKDYAGDNSSYDVGGDYSCDGN